MRRARTILAAGVFGIVLAGGSGVASADPPGIEVRPAPNAGSNANCLGLASAQVIHNGQYVTLGQGGDPSHGARGEEVKAFQAACPPGGQD